SVAKAEQQKALHEQLIADSLKLLAEQSAKSVSKLRLLSIAKTLAIKSLQLRKTGADEQSALLALQAFEFNRRNGGPEYEHDLYGALHSAEHASDSTIDDELKMH